MPISEFRQKKLLYVFHVFFDVDRSGTIEQNDFELALEKIGRMRGYSKTDQKYLDTQKTLLTIWEGLKATADKDGDGQISTQEWLNVWEEFSAAPDKPLDWQTQYQNFIFDLQDTSGDGTIDEGEFVSVCSGYGISDADGKESFDKFSDNNKVEVNRTEFANLWKQFFTSDDPNVRGNFIFGKTKFD